MKIIITQMFEHFIYPPKLLTPIAVVLMNNASGSKGYNLYIFGIRVAYWTHIA